MVKKHEKTEIPILAKVSAFFSSNEDQGQNLSTYYPIEQLKPNLTQPRKHFNEGEILQLAESIKHCGVLEPILVTAENKGERIILAGERRYRAAKLAGLKTVPIYQLDLPPKIASQVPLIENLLRRDLTPFEELEGYLTLLENNLSSLPEFKSFSAGIDIETGIIKLLFAMRNAHNGRRVNVNQTLVNTVVQLFSAIGSSSWQSFVTHRLSLRKLPSEIQNALREGWLDYTKAIVISRLTDKKLGNSELAYKTRLDLLERIKTENLSIREIKNLVQEILNTHIDKEDSSSKVKNRVNNLFSDVKKNYSALTEKEQEKLNYLLGEIEQLIYQ
ncbi:MAG: ParB/RepB/Spo0J family partition protein [Acidobacteria bacterium]|nr:ParB/RepB/Spo0J family partition protein [Acidobacteriota bacterium]